MIPVIRFVFAGSRADDNGRSVQLCTRARSVGTRTRPEEKVSALFARGGTANRRGDRKSCPSRRRDIRQTLASERAKREFTSNRVPRA